VSGPDLRPPQSGLVGRRIEVEFGGAEEFVHSLQRALARGGERGATLVAGLEGGDLSIHIPREDGPCWNSVPLVHVHRGEEPKRGSWTNANAILEKLERYR
jgi:hypothetical protein